MKWNWQIEGWPEFTYDSEALAPLEAKFLTSSGVLLGTCSHLDEGELSELRIELMSDEALKTSEIEGNDRSELSNVGRSAHQSDAV